MAPQIASIRANDESTPLLGVATPRPAQKKKQKQWLSQWSPASRVLLTGFLATLSFSFTQVPIIYIFRVMVCDAYYSEQREPLHGAGHGGTDRCDNNIIASRTAAQLAILAVSTTLCGTINLFLSGWQAKRLGPRAALMIQIFIPAIRIGAQILGVFLGGRRGIITFQVTQIITIFGGPAGYILLVNSIASEVVEPLQRTAVFGRLQGCFMLGQATGFLSGGMLGDKFGIRTPFETAFCGFLLSTTYVYFAIPYLPPTGEAAGKKTLKGIKGFFAPLKVLAPQRVRLANGQVKKHYGVMFLCLGVFMGVLATGYVMTLLQLYSTDKFGFSQGGNGLLTSGNALMRAMFLTLLFPRIIDWGRKWFINGANASTATTAAEAAADSETPPLELPTEPGMFNAPTGVQGEDRPPEPMAVAPAHERAACAFDLYFLRWSLLLDAFFTSVSAYATQGWHMYVAAFLLPLGSGSAPAAKGVITEMCPPSQRTDALSAITLVENIATLSTLSLFGFVFSTLSEMGQAHLTFFLNAAVAVLAMIVLLFSHFPPKGSELVEEDDSETGEPYS